MSQDKASPTSLEADISEITQSLGRTERPKVTMRPTGVVASFDKRTIIERISHIRNEICELDSALMAMHSDIMEKIGRP